MDPALLQQLNQYVEVAMSGAELVRNTFGSGLPKECYLDALAVELKKSGLEVTINAEVPIVYDGQQLASSFPLDIVANSQIYVKVIAQQKIDRTDEARAKAGLRVSNLPMALILNFSESSIRGDIRRIMNPNYQ
ncbi:MAG: GxxExxY protein [Planctomycetota bacterium]